VLRVQALGPVLELRLTYCQLLLLRIEVVLDLQRPGHRRRAMYFDSP
jgi:hypothetical protein